MNWLKEIFSASSGRLSSKRVCGVFGFIACIIVLFYCTYNTVQAPTMIDIFLVTCCGLLGVDSVTDIWKNKNEVG